MTLVEFEVGDPEPYKGEVAIRAKSPEAKQRGDSKYWFVVAIVTPEKPVGQGRTECAAWIKRNLDRIGPDIEREYHGEPLCFDHARLREFYGD